MIFSEEFPLQWVPGGEVRFLICGILILLVWYGWQSLTEDDRRQKAEDKLRKKELEGGD